MIPFQIERRGLQKRLAKELATLRRRGMDEPRIDDLPDLLAVAQALAKSGTSIEQIEGVLAFAIDRYGLESKRRKMVRLWFGIETETLHLGPTERHGVAFEHDDSTTSRTTFETHRAREIYNFLARELAAAYDKGLITSSSKGESRVVVAPVVKPEPSLDAGSLGNVVLGELRRLFTHGFDTRAYEHAPTLVRLAHEYDRVERSNKPSGDFLEVFLRWIISQSGDSDYVTGTIELLGIGRFRGSELQPRRDRAAPFFGYKSGRAFRYSRTTPTENQILKRLANLCVKFAGEIPFRYDA